MERVARTKPKYNYRCASKKDIVIESTYCWWSFINNLANMEPWTVSEPRQRYKDGQEEILRRCPAVAEELRTVTELPRRPRGWRCNDYLRVNPQGTKMLLSMSL